MIKSFLFSFDVSSATYWDWISWLNATKYEWIEKLILRRMTLVLVKGVLSSSHWIGLEGCLDQGRLNSWSRDVDLLQSHLAGILFEFILGIFKGICRGVP